MIKLAIIKSEDKNQIGEFLFGKNQIVFSKSSKADISSTIDFAVEIINNHIFLLNPKSEILVNNKFSGELSQLKVNSIIGTDKFQIQILEFEMTKELTTREILNKNTEYIIKNKPDRLKEITRIRNENKDV